MVPEARMQDGDGGKQPAGEGWFIVNARDAAWFHNDKFGAGVTFEGRPRFQHYGINIQVLWPGQPNGYYHAEDGQEDFLVLSGEGLLLVEGEERPVRAWDFVHFPPGTEHILVGSGDEPRPRPRGPARGPVVGACRRAGSRGRSPSGASRRVRCCSSSTRPA
jgi:quercetin dioxygenase-like cupin family protein